MLASKIRPANLHIFYVAVMHFYVIVCCYDLLL